MLITSSTKEIYIDTDLLKKRFCRVLDASTIVLAVAGFICIIGTEGASKTTDISIYQTLKNAFIGFSLCGVAFILNTVKNALQSRS